MQILSRVTYLYLDSAERELPKIARRFQRRDRANSVISPEGRLRPRSSLRDFSLFGRFPAVETAGYYQMFLRNKRSSNKLIKKHLQRPPLWLVYISPLRFADSVFKGC